MNVLVIDDAINEKNLLTEIIEKNFLDVRVYRVNNEIDMINRLKEKKIWLVFINTKLKIGSGILLGQKIRQIKEFRLLPIVFISDDVINIIEAFKKVHCYDYLIKPYTESQIKGIIQVFLDYYNTFNPEKPSSIIEINSCLTRKIYHDEILFIEYRDRCCYIYLNDEVICWKGMPLSKAISSLNNSNIVQTHKAFAANVKNILEINKISEKSWQIEFARIKEKALLSYKYKNNVLGREKIWI